MIKVLFICHGNICRSPMAEFVFKGLVKKQGLEACFEIASCATSSEEIGNPIHPGAARKLREHGISCSGHRARRITKADYDHYDYLICMEQWNIRNLGRVLCGDQEGKVHLLLDFTDRPGDIDDPWYSGDFSKAYDDIKRGCEGLLTFLQKQK